ncbi:hypothetical protein L596_012464 [Steinernema carpocapsae]|uniref:Uncharacterized protein n=1 Tax=Steinernema carpocapsae TaxID=34508 RepID=A0A4U5NX57_STECR|nr:hypothetical protein L596_012464 [Steinernema carpocapsae]
MDRRVVVPIEPIRGPIAPESPLGSENSDTSLSATSVHDIEFIELFGREFDLAFVSIVLLSLLLAGVILSLLVSGFIIFKYYKALEAPLAKVLKKTSSADLKPKPGDQKGPPSEAQTVGTQKEAANREVIKESTTLFADSSLEPILKTAEDTQVNVLMEVDKTSRASSDPSSIDLAQSAKDVEWTQQSWKEKTDEAVESFEMF